MTLENLLLKTKNRDVIITVIGLGRVGLPLASVLANSGFKISGIDANQSRL